MSPETRASDDDRQRVVDTLQQHTAAGRLTLDEFADRVGHVWAARTLGDLHAVTHDLPGASDAAAAPRRELLAVFAVAAITLLLLGLYMALIR